MDNMFIQRIDSHWSYKSSPKNQASILNISRYILVFIIYIYSFCRPTDGQNIQIIVALWSEESSQKKKQIFTLNNSQNIDVSL